MILGVQLMVFNSLSWQYYIKGPVSLCLHLCSLFSLPPFFLAHLLYPLLTFVFHFLLWGNLSLALPHSSHLLNGLPLFFQILLKMHFYKTIQQCFLNGIWFSYSLSSHRVHFMCVNSPVCVWIGLWLILGSWTVSCYMFIHCQVYCWYSGNK